MEKYRIKNTLVQYTIIITILFAHGCACGLKHNVEVPTVPSNNAPNEPSKNIVWNLQENLYTAAEWIDKTDNWLLKLGINKDTKETVVVNAANEHIASPGGGIDGALGGWASAHGLQPWKLSKLPNGSVAPASLPAGNFALFSTPFGEIYLAVGPRAANIESLQKTTELIANLYYNILTKAKTDGRKNIVLCAISTEIFASDGVEKDSGKSFKKDEFINSVYAGMQQGIGKFQRENLKHTLRIILNNWGSSSKISKKNLIGDEVIKGVKRLN